MLRASHFRLKADKVQSQFKMCNDTDMVALFKDCHFNFQSQFKWPDQFCLQTVKSKWKLLCINNNNHPLLLGPI